MREIFRFDNVQDYNDFLGLETVHPLVGLVDFADVESIRKGRKYFGFYCVIFKELECGTLLYGRSRYDYQEGTVVFISPGQVAGAEGDGLILNPKGRVLMFHPDLLYGTPLAKRMKDYNFFSYSSNEALHLSDSEKALIFRCFDDIGDELGHVSDKYSKHIVTSMIETLLNYCTRFYERQFVSRSKSNVDVLARFENIVNEYYDSEEPRSAGLPTVQYCAEQVCLSPNYFGDLVKKETGKTAQEYIQRSVVEKAKEQLADSDLTVSEIAYRLGFSYPHHLNRMFRKYVGMTPGEYRRNI